MSWKLLSKTSILLYLFVGNLGMKSYVNWRTDGTERKMSSENMYQTRSSNQEPSVSWFIDLPTSPTRASAVQRKFAVILFFCISVQDKRQGSRLLYSGETSLYRRRAYGSTRSALVKGCFRDICVSPTFVVPFFLGIYRSGVASFLVCFASVCFSFLPALLSTPPFPRRWL